MKKAMISILILTVLGFWIPSAGAEISRDLDPMVSPEPQATVTSESPVSAMAAGQTSNAVNEVGTTKEKKKTEETKKKKAKKSSVKKSSSKKSSKLSSEKSKPSKNSSN
ncbi:MAG: hypothetical protein V1673_04185 [Candidatus Omnitrophota bacterium]